MATDLSTDPRLDALLAATRSLTAAGMPFEVVDEEVLGQRLRVFRNRSHTMRDVLLGADRFGDRDCYVFGDGTRIHFDELVPVVGLLACGLQEGYDIGPGDRVAVCAANCREWILTFWAVASLDAVLVAMNGWWTGAEMRKALELTDPKLLVMDEKRRARLEGDPGVPTLVTEHDFAGLADATTAKLPDSPIAEDDPFILIFTSGTTGRPKAAVLSHRSVISYLMEQSFIGARGMALAGMSAPPAGPPPARLAPYPLFHVSGMSMAVSTVMSGSTSVWPLGRFDAGEVIELTKQERISVWGGGTTHVVRLLQHPDVATIAPAQISSVGVGGSATPPDVVRQIEERFPHLAGAVSSGYGSTETGLISWAPGWMLKAAPDCVGPLMPTVDARITDDDGTELPSGSEGNIEARSCMSMLGYWHNDAADAETIRPGRWIRTGDFGRLDDGILFIASRNARPDHPRRREHLPVRDRAPARRTPRRRGGRGLRDRRSRARAGGEGGDRRARGDRAHRGRRARVLRHHARVLQGAVGGGDPHRAAAAHRDRQGDEAGARRRRGEHVRRGVRGSAAG